MKGNFIRNRLLALALAAIVFTGMTCPVMAADSAGGAAAAAAGETAAEVDPLDPAIAGQSDKEKGTAGQPADPAYRISSDPVMIGSANYRFGVDVSEWQGGKINWAKAKKAGVEFALIRVGYAGLRTGDLVEDKYYKTNIVNAHKNGIKVGAYIYSQAVNSEEAKKEADFIISKLKPYKSYINMPVAWDMESPKTYKDGRESYNTHWWCVMKGKTRAQRKSQTKNSWLAFAKTVKAAGYTPMFYSYTDWIYNYMNMPALRDDGYPFWLAEHNSSPSTFTKYFGSGYKYDFWQYSSTGRLSGFSGDVDKNRWYTDDINLYTPYTGQAAVQISSITANAAKISWGKVSGASKYKVAVQNSAGETIQTYTTKDGNTTSYNITGLTPETTYKVYVRPYRKTVAGKRSAEVSFTTAKKYTGKADVSVAVSTTTATAGWGPVSEATKYAVAVKSGAGKKVKAATVNPSSKKMSYRISGLTDGTRYSVSVIPYKGNLAGYETKKTFTTKAIPYTAKVKIKGKNYNSSASVTWGKAKQATKYVVQTSTNKKTWKKYKTVKSCKAGIYGLSNGNAKYIRVIPYKSNKEGKASNVILVHGKFNYTVKDSRGRVMTYKLGSKYYKNSRVAARGKIKVTARTKTGLNLRKSASTRSKRLLTIGKGKTVTVLKQGAKWNKVKYGRKTGYVYKKYLK